MSVATISIKQALRFFEDDLERAKADLESRIGRATARMVHHAHYYHALANEKPIALATADSSDTTPDEDGVDDGFSDNIDKAEAEMDSEIEDAFKSHDWDVAQALRSLKAAIAIMESAS